jgi:TonB family protein
MVIAVLAITLAALATSATAPTPTGAQFWLERPSGQDIADAYPDRAQFARVTGQALLDCGIATDGRLDLCRVFGEAPPDWGFGRAALRLVPKFRTYPPPTEPSGGEPRIFIPVYMHINYAPPPKPLILESPRWASAPSFKDLADAFPAASKAEAGDVSFRCRVDPRSGALDACETLSEHPANQGFAGAARTLTPRFRVEMARWLRQPDDDLAVEIKIHFASPKSEDFLSRRIGPPTRIAWPGEADAAARFPTAAAAKGLTKGRGVASCAVAPDGRLRDCVPLAGEPDGLGFSEAAVQIASAMRMNPWTDAGGPVDGAHVQLPIRFDLPATKP